MPRGRPSREIVFQRLQESINDLKTRLGGLPRPIEAEDIWDDLWHQEAHHSTALEGNTLVLKQVKQLLDEGRAVGAKELREYMEVKGYADAAKWVYGHALDSGSWETADLLTVQEVRSIHHMALSPVWNVAPHPNASPEETPGNWRRHEIEPFPGGMTPPSFTDVPPLMSDWLTEVTGLRRSTENALPLSMARMHNRFERIHPFLDGTGRAGRLLLNLVLVRLGYPPAIIFKHQRNRYLSAMRKADRDDFGPLAELIARSVIDNLQKFVVPAIAGPSRLVPLTSLARKGVTSESLRVAAIRGRLRAHKTSTGGWVSSRKWVEEYLKSKWRRNQS